MSNYNSTTIIMDMIMAEKILMDIKALATLLYKGIQHLITTEVADLHMITMPITTTTIMGPVFMHTINRNNNNSRLTVIMIKIMGSRAIRTMMSSKLHLFPRHLIPT
jgi:hypothetical protein